MDPKFKKRCDELKIIRSDQSQIEEFQSLLTYPEEIIDSIFSKIERYTDIRKLIEIFRYLKNREQLLSQLTDGKTVNDLDRSVSLLSVELFIQAEFPKWNYELAANLPKHPIFDFDRERFMNISPNGSFSTYSEICYEGKESLNETLDSNNNLLVQKLLYDLNMSILNLTSNLDFLEEIEAKLKEFVKNLDSEVKIIELISAVEILNEWNVDTFEGITRAFEIISNSSQRTVRRNIHNFVLNEFFPRTWEKSLHRLIEELLTSNFRTDIDLLKNRRALKEEYQAVMEAYESESFLDVEGPIKSWNKLLITAWSKCFKLRRIVKDLHDMNLNSEVKPQLLKTLADEFPSTSESHDSAKAQKFSDHVTDSVSKYEKLAVIIRTIERTVGIRLRVIQILAIILLLDAEGDRGRLAQIGTGEGKTIIIAVLAAYYALDGRKVDIVTSSKLLVYPQMKELKNFYEYLGLSVSHNFESSKAYLSDIVYGTSSQFQGDILRDEFRKLNTRHKRECDIVIIDEVDNMLIDGNNHIVYLSCNMPGMDHLETLLAVISIQIKAAAAALRMEDGKLYFVQCENAIDENGEIKDEIIENYIPVDVSPHEFIRKATDLHLRKLIRYCDESTIRDLSSDYPEIKIPKHLRELICRIQLKKWIEKAIMAKVGCANKEDYILDKDEIKIVDAENTGVVQNDMQWSDGLHQFIQIKHGACLTPESFTTNFISNVSYFRRYGPYIYGLTGTLGSRETRQFLKDTYSVDDVIIPTFKLKQHRELKAIIIENEEDWLREIVYNSIQKLINGRAVLIIMEYIRQIEIIERIFINEFNYDINHIKLYKTDRDSDAVEHPLHLKDVLITTNIAGRGANIKVHDYVDGGLHVCLTFLPKNSRVEEQNIGRTSRTGNCGTSQFILNNKEKSIMTLREQRSQKEVAALGKALREIERVTMKDDIFHEFCELTDDIKDENDDEFVSEIERKAVEERFAIWLKMNREEIASASRSEVFRLFGFFRHKILRDKKVEELVKNPYMFVEIGNKYLEKKDYITAIEKYTLAIELDPDFAEHAHFNRGYAYIAQYGGDLSANVYEIDEAIRDFRKSRKLIEEKEYNLHLMQNASENEVYSRQISNKLNLYNILKSAIEIAIGPDKKAIDRSLRDLENRQNKVERYSENWREIAELIEDLEERRENMGVIQEAQDNELELRIKFINWKECLPIADDSYDKEIEEFIRNGAIGSFIISELPPIDWTSVIGLMLLGMGQLIAGAALAVFTLGAGASFGAALIAEGISDIITAIKDGIINRDFSWERWAIEKAISLTISVVCVGWVAMKDVAMTIRGGARIAGGLGRRAVPQAVREGWRIVFRKVGVDLTKAAAKEFVGTLANYGIAETLVPWLRCRIIEIVEGLIERALEENQNVEMMLELDKTRNNSRYEDRIREVGLELLNPKKSHRNSAIAKFAEKMSNRVLDHRLPQVTYHRKLHALMANAERALLELPVLAYEFVKDLNEAIEKMAKDEKIEKLYRDREKSRIRGDGSIGVAGSSKRVDSGINVGRFADEEEQVKPQHSGSGALRIAKNYSNSIAKSIVNVIQRDYVLPVVQMGVGYSVDRAMAHATETSNGYIEAFKSRRRAPRMIDEEFEAD